MADETKTTVSTAAPTIPPPRRKIKPPADLLSEKSIIEYLKDSRDSHEWNAKLQHIKDANDGDVPDWYHDRVIASGLAREVSKKWDTI
jgi:hypothetical protein